MMVTVRDPGGGEGAATGSGALRRAIVAGVLFAVFGVVARGWFGSRLLGCDDGHRLAAERILDENRPSDDHQAGQPQHTGQPLRRGSRDIRQALAFDLAEGGVQIVRCHSAESSRIIGGV